MRARSNPLVLLTVSSFALALVAVASLAVLAARRSSDEADLARIGVVRDLVLDEFVEPVAAEQLTRDALRGMLAGLDDYSRYYAEQEAAAVEEETTGRFAGTGIVRDPEVRDAFEVLFPRPGSPAERAGVRPGTRLVAIDGASVDLMTAEEARDRVRGEEGTFVRIAFYNPDDPELHEATIRRGVLREPSASRARMLDAERGIGAVWISSFTEETPAQLDAALADLARQGLKGLILDLRFNTGGVLSAAADIANRFVASGPIYETRGRRHALRYEARADRSLPSPPPLVVLINGETASASEVLAGALADYRVATIVGQRSYGKGVVQALKRFEDGGAYVKLTTAHYYTPAGRNLERSHGDDPDETRAGGIAPDVEVPMRADEQERLRDWLALPEVPAVYAEDVAAIRVRRSARRATVADPQLAAALALMRGEAPPDRRLRP